MEGIRLSESALIGMVKKEWKILGQSEREEYSRKSREIWTCDTNYRPFDMANYTMSRGDVDTDRGVSADIPVLKKRINTWNAYPETIEFQKLGRRIMAGQLAKHICEIPRADPVVLKHTQADIIDAVNESSKQMRDGLLSFAGFKDENELQGAIDAVGFSSMLDDTDDTNIAGAEVVEALPAKSRPYRPRKPTRSRSNVAGEGENEVPSSVIYSKKRSRRLLISKSSQYHHVWQDDYRPNKWKTYVRLQSGRYQFFGGFDTEEAAARAHDVVARHVHGSIAICNFDEQGNRVELNN